MPQQRLFRLIVDDLTAGSRFNLRLTDGQGQFLAAHEVRANPTHVCWRGLFEMDAYLEVQRGRGVTDAELLAELGDFLRTDVLGLDIAALFFESRRPGVIFIELPRERRPEALELTRVPWELVCDERGRTLSDVGLAVQILPQGVMPLDVSLDRALTAARPFAPDGPLRVLIAFAQSREQAALAMRKMRERLTHFFLEELALRYQIEVDFLQYGVTRQMLERTARRGGGYHIVHLFAHGHEDLLVLEKEDGSDDYISGAQIAACLSGEFAAPPYLVFLTACHSGEVKLQSEIADLWQALRQMRGTAQEAAQASRDLVNFENLYTGVAFAMLQAEVPQAVAMRYTVEETFAFDLAEQFYRYVLLDEMPPALALGRFRADARREGDQRGYRAHDWVTPAFFGGAEGSQSILLREGRSEDADRLWIRGRLPDELRRADRFVGRTDELRGLHHHLFDEQPDQTVALLWGVGGLGKTALAAEAVHLWHSDFDFILGTHPAGDQPLSLNWWLQEVDYHVMTALGERGYHIWEEQGDAPYERWLASRLTELLRFLNTHRLLLVIDNFELNLRLAGEEGEVHYVCTDPNWSATLTCLADGLTPGLSRLLVTSRWVPVELTGRRKVLNLPIGPLPPSEWGVFSRTAPNFRSLLLGDDESRDLLARALSVARGHPLILDALERLAVDPADLSQRLDEFEARGEHYAGMGDLLATERLPEERAQEMAYFEDVAAVSVRALIEERSPETQWLLRVMAMALEPLYDELIRQIWEDASWPEDMPRLQPLESDWRRSLEELHDAGLITERQQTGIMADGTPTEIITYICHPIVTEQAVEVLPTEGFPEDAYLQRYANFYQDVVLQFWPPKNQAQAQMRIKAASYAIRYSLRLGDAKMAIRLIDQTHLFSDALDFRRDMQGWINELLEQSLADETHGTLLYSIADIYMREGRSEEAVSLYRQVLATAEAQEDWRACGGISHRLGLALRNVAEYTAARAAYHAALRYMRRKGRGLGRLATLCELVRLLIITGGEENLVRARAHAARLVQIARAYYEQHLSGPVAVKGKCTDLLVQALDIQRMIEHRAENWSIVLRICDEQGKLVAQRRNDTGFLRIAPINMNRAVALKCLGYLDRAEQTLFDCLQACREYQQPLYEARVLSELASLTYLRGDPNRAVQFEAQALDIRYRFSSLSEAGLTHYNLAGYCLAMNRLRDAVQNSACAALIHTHTGQYQNATQAVSNLRDLLVHLSVDDLRAHWPTAATLSVAHPLLMELLAARGVGLEQAQGILDQLWEVVSG